ncbi:glycosyltransferase [Paenibacillus aurantiacus]|uniref:Glycosyltransferase n=1 Tax=Paenibacillus aurantiacus TaxID=1936118 RepID=A0ABV5KIL8_9BACL
MKKKLLFVMNNLTCGGAEKALVSLLGTIDYSRFDVDLLLFKHEGLFMKQIPQQVRLLAEPRDYRYFDMPVKTAVADCLRRGRLGLAVARVRAGFIFRGEPNRVRCEQRVWKYVAQSLPPLAQSYDAVIGYLEKNPIYYGVEKVNAVRKIGFIHNDYDRLGMDPGLDYAYFEQLDDIVTVSEGCVEVLKKRFPMLEDRIALMPNIVSPALIRELAQEQAPDLARGALTLVSVGRLSAQKGYELAIEACALLVAAGYDVKWTVIGEGEERERLSALIRARGLTERFLLAGLRENPYAYMRQSDIFVQTSRFEGKSVAIDEAKILGKPIVVTDFPTAKDQIEDGVNGLIAAMDARSVTEAIRRLAEEPALRESFARRLAEEELGTEQEIETLYRFIS